MLQLRVKAPFAAFRSFVAGSYRPTAPFFTISAAYGLILNIAAIEARYDDGVSPMTLLRTDLPAVEVAVGAVSLPETQTLYQQLHNYPVGATGKERAGDTKGNKYNIQPIRREFLSGLDAYVCLRGNDLLENRVREGLRLGSGLSSPEGQPRYGMPFLGDNNFTISVLREDTAPVPAHWFVRADRGAIGSGSDLSRLTVWIDRLDQSKTRSGLFRRIGEPMVEVPEAAWTPIPPGDERA